MTWVVYAMQMGGVYSTCNREKGLLLESIVIEMGGVSCYFSKVSQSGVGVTLLTGWASPRRSPMSPQSSHLVQHEEHFERTLRHTQWSSLSMFDQEHKESSQTTNPKPQPKKHEDCSSCAMSKEDLLELVQDLGWSFVGGKEWAWSFSERSLLETREGHGHLRFRLMDVCTHYCMEVTESQSQWCQSAAFSAIWFRIFRIFRVFALWNLLRPFFFLGWEGPSAFSPHWVRIVDFKNPTDQLYYHRP